MLDLFENNANNIEEENLDRNPKVEYFITESSDGFTVHADQRSTTKVTLTNRYLFKVENIESTRVNYIGPYNFRDLVSVIVDSLMTNYHRPINKVKNINGKRAYSFLNKSKEDLPKRLREWVYGNVGRAINKRIHAQWVRLVETIPEERSLLAKSLFRTSLNYNKKSVIPELYSEHPYLVKDVSRYFSAAGMFHFGQDLTLYVNEEIIEYASLYEKNNNHSHSHDFYYDPEYDLINIDSTVGINFYDRTKLNGKNTSYESNIISYEQYFKLMEHWRSLYSYNGKPYRALDITLHHATHVSPRMMIMNLPLIKLERPIYQRLELAMILCAYSIVADPSNGPQQWPGQTDVAYQLSLNAYNTKLGNAHLFQYATQQQIKTMLDHVSDHVYRRNENRFSHRKIKDLMQAAHFILEYPEIHTGNVVGLADKSIEWHRYVNEQREAARRKLSNPNTKNMLPPVPLPEVEGITFLETVGMLFDESKTMEHCVYTYAGSTTRGQSFIFHIEKNGDIATIEVNNYGEIVQAQGPHNRQDSQVKSSGKNMAIVYGRKILNKWASSFRQKDNTKVSIDNVRDVADHGYIDVDEEENLDDLGRWHGHAPDPIAEIARNIRQRMVNQGLINDHFDEE